MLSILLGKSIDVADCCRFAHCAEAFQCCAQSFVAVLTRDAPSCESRVSALEVSGAVRLSYLSQVLGDVKLQRAVYGRIEGILD